MLNVITAVYFICHVIWARVRFCVNCHQIVKYVVQFGTKNARQRKHVYIFNDLVKGRQCDESDTLRCVVIDIGHEIESTHQANAPSNLKIHLNRHPPIDAILRNNDGKNSDNPT